MAADSTSKGKFPRAWDALTPPLAEWIIDAVTSWGFASMTPVQAATIPLFLGNKDVVVEAVTGSGKTLAFLIPAVVRLLRLEEPLKRHHVGAIVVSPTRELATQIHSVLLSLLAFHEPSSQLLPYLRSSGEEKRPLTTVPVVVPQLLVGGTNATVAQDLSFFLRHSSNVLVATPGRLAELLSSPHVQAPQSSFEMLVLDEADRLLELGFKQDIQRILGFLPKQRRTGLFSASVSEAVGEIVRAGLRNPQRVSVTVKSRQGVGGDVVEARTPASLQMSYLVLQASHKFPALFQLLELLEPRPQRSIVFLSTCFAVQYFQAVLPALLPAGFTLVPLHGKLKPAVREKCFGRFVSASSPTVLLTTDVAARGLDIPQVDLVVQVDPPSDPKVFIHRCGRAGRAGRRGLAIAMLLPGREEDFVPFLAARKTPITPLTRPIIAVSADEAEACSSAMRARALADRAVFELAQRGFVASVRAYLEHRASSIFRVSELPWEDLARAWGLLELPRMPELRGLDIDRSLGLGVNTAAIPFKDAARERKRLVELEERRAAREEIGGSVGGVDRATQRRKNEAWSGKREREDLRVERREKRQKRREAEKLAGMTERELEEKRKLDELIGEVRRRREAEAQVGQAAGGDRDEFEGFGD